MLVMGADELFDGPLNLEVKRLPLWLNFTATGAKPAIAPAFQELYVILYDDELVGPALPNMRRPAFLRQAD